MHRTLLSLFTALTLPLALVACGDDTEEPDASGTTAAAADVFPVTVEHAFGTTTIESKPERIATANSAASYPSQPAGPAYCPRSNGSSRAIASSAAGVG